MRSIQFPDMFTATTTNVVSDYEATKQNLTMLLRSTKGELFGDPYYGTNLLKYLYEQNDVILEDLVIDDIYYAITEFIPQVRVTREDVKLTRDKGKITATIRAMNKRTYQTDMYSIVLLQTEM